MKPLFSGISQIAVVIPDIDKAVKVFTDELGVGPLLSLRFGEVREDTSFGENAVVLPIDDYFLDGEYVGSYGIYMAAVSLGNGVQLEMISPAKNRSLFRKYLDEHGAGAQHICIDHGRDYDGYLKLLGEMAVAGNPLASVCKVDRAETCAFVHHEDTLGVCVEAQYRPEDYQVPDIDIPMIAANREKQPKPLTDAVTGITFAVKRLEPVLELLEKRYGIGPWKIGEPGFHGFKDSIYTEIRVASCNALNIELELFEPVNPDDEHDEVVRFLHRNGGNGVFSVHLTAPEGVDILKSRRRVLFGNQHSGLLDFTEELGIYLKFDEPEHM